MAPQQAQVRQELFRDLPAEEGELTPKLEPVGRLWLESPRAGVPVALQGKWVKTMTFNTRAGEPVAVAVLLTVAAAWEWMPQGVVAAPVVE